MMRTSTILVASSLCLMMAAAGAFAEDGRGKTARTDTSGKVPSTSVGTTTTTPPATAAATLGPAGEGRRAWLKYNCSGCHGDRAGGAMGPNVVRADNGDLSEAVREGEEGGMPAYRRILTSTEITNIGVYLRSIGTAGEPKFNDWWVAVPTK